jgi:hypothetical protein
MGKTLAEMALCGFAALGIFGTPYVGAQPAVPATQDLQPPQAPGQKSPIPSDAEIKLAEKEIREVYKDEYKITDPAKRKVFAEKLLTNGRESTNNAQKYVLLRDATNTLADMLELDGAYNATKVMKDTFEGFNALEACDKYLAAAQKKTKTKEDAGKVAEAYLQLTDAAVDEKNYKMALSSAKSAETIGKKSGDASLVEKAGDLIKAIPDIEREYSGVKKAEDTLKLNPNDPEANTIVGKYLAFVDNDWDAGLKHLSRGMNGVSKIADQEMILRSAGTDDPDATCRVADLWYEQSNKSSNTLDKKRFATHAFELYQQAQTKATGLVKDKIDKRIVQLAKFYKPKEHSSSGLVGHWDFEDVSDIVSDLSGKNNQGKLNGVKKVPGPKGMAISFDGVDDYVDLGSKGLPKGNEPQTVAFYFQIDAVPKTPSQSILVLSDLPNSLTQMGLRHGKLALWKRGGTIIVSANMPSSNLWHHFAYTFNGKEHKLYLDGKLQDTSVVETNTSSYKILELGRWSGEGGKEYFQGSIDDVRIYTRVLKDSEIQLFSNSNK